MKIGIDTFSCDHAKSGLGAYLLYFTENLSNSDDLSVELFGSEYDKFNYISGKDIVYKSVLIKNDRDAERKWHSKFLKKFINQQKYDVVIYPAIERVVPT